MYIRTNKEEVMLMQKYIIKKRGVEYLIRSDQDITGIQTNPALFFVCNGDYQVERCGQLTAFRQLKSHMLNLVKKWGKCNV